MKKGGGREAPKYTVTYGGWYQRTTLHLSEIHEFLAFGTSRLPLDPKKLKELRSKMRLSKVTRESGELEFVRARTKEGIEIRYYEDGLYILEIQASGIALAQELLHDYFENVFQPGISYIFSLGAPTPKVVANIPSTHPIVVGAKLPEPEKFEVDQATYGTVYQKIVSDDIAVFKTSSHIFIIADPEITEPLQTLIEMQVFFREFKDQLGKYLQIHRTIWEEITKVKEQKEVKMGELQKIRNQLDSYQATVSLIANRINQMGSYVHTRAQMSRELHLEKYLQSLFHFKFEVLTNTMEYIKEIWKMTSEYLGNTIRVIVELQNTGANRSIQSLRTITTFGVLANIVVFMTRVTTLDNFNYLSLVFLVALMALAWLFDRFLRQLADRATYELKFTERSKEV